MPEQPADPLHYEMKIPPEPHPDKDDNNSDKPPADDDSRKSDTAKDTSVVRGDDKPQSVRRPG